ncbi:MAG: hypothetical protein ABI234_15685 [Ktedonobacteraceae bacterium]
MEQQLVFPEMKKNAQPRRFALAKAKILSTFFAVDRSPDNHQIVDLQRRACWIGLALVLQALNEINVHWYVPYVPFLQAWEGLIPFALILGSFYMMWKAFRPSTLKQRTQRLEQHPQRWQRIVLSMVLITALVGIFVFGWATAHGLFTTPQYTNDGTALDENAAMQLLQGHNPYTNSDLAHIVRLFNLSPDLTTPLRQGQFANRLDYPSPVDLRSVYPTSLKSGHLPEFESKVSYPALSFLSLVPFVWLGIYNVLPFYLLCYIALVALGWKMARRELRPWVILFSLANVAMIGSVVGGNLDVLAILFVVISWLGRERRWLSALTLGLALACKQPTWFFVPFYAIIIFRTYGWKETAWRLVIAGTLTLALNLPFILWNAGAWLAGVMAPVSDPMFPMGVGIVGLVGAPFLPSYMPSMIYSILEYGIFYPACIAWYWRICKAHPEAAMLLAVLPLFFAWRSLPSYFACAAFPMFILIASRGNMNKGSQPHRTPTLGEPPVEILPVEHKVENTALVATLA